MFCHPSHWRLTYPQWLLVFKNMSLFLLDKHLSICVLCTGLGLLPYPGRKEQGWLQVLEVQFSLCRKSLKCTLNRAAQHACMELLAEKEEICRRNERLCSLYRHGGAALATVLPSVCPRDEALGLRWQFYCYGFREAYWEGFASSAETSVRGKQASVEAVEILQCMVLVEFTAVAWRGGSDQAAWETALWLFSATFGALASAGSVSLISLIAPDAPGLFSWAAFSSQKENGQNSKGKSSWLQLSWEQLCSSTCKLWKETEMERICGLGKWGLSKSKYLQSAL